MTDHLESPAPHPPDPVSEEDARAAFFTSALEDTDRMLHSAEAMRVQMMLAGFEAMLLEEEAALGHRLDGDDPAIRSFFLHQASVLRTSRIDAQQQVLAARTLRDRLPRTWAVFLTGGCSQRVAEIVADQSEGLDPATTAAIDAAAATLVQRERPGMVERKLIALREKLQPAATTERHRAASARRHVSARPAADGQGVLQIHATATDIAALYDAIRQSAIAAHGAPGECRTLGQLMADCALDMVLQSAALGTVAAAGGPAYPMERLGDTRVPSRKKIDVTLLVTVPADVATGSSDGTASLAGSGSIDSEVAQQIVAHTATWTRVLVDPITDEVLGIDSHDRYIPSGLRKLIHARNQTCVGDDCGMPAHRTDLDHLVRYEHDGRTRHDNLQPLCRSSHLAKDERDFWDVRLLPDGTPQWRSKWGATRTIEPALKTRTTIRYPDEAPF